MKLKFRSTLIATVLAAGKTATSLVDATADTSNTRNGQPKEIRSKDGLLEVTLTVDLFTTPDLNRTAPAYNGSPVGPTLRAKPGDKVRITFINNLPPSSPENLEAMVFAGTPFSVDNAENINQTLLVNRLQYPTGNLWAIPRDDYWGHGFQNLHFHGLMVDPTIDDGRVYIDGGEQMIYEWQIPEDSPRLFGFYHNHVHGTGAYSMLSGLYGAFVIEDPASHQVTADIAAAPQVSEHFLLLSESKTYEDGSPMNFIPIVMAFDWTHVTNGQVNPTYHFKKGETVLFRAVNAGVEPPMFLSIESHGLLPYARDGFPIPSPQVTDTVHISAGMRSEFLVKFDTPGTYRFVRSPANFGISGELCGVLFGMPPEVTTCISFDKEDTIANIVVSEEEVETDETIELWDPLDVTNANVEPAKKRGVGSDYEMAPYLQSLLDLPNAGSRTITLNQATSFPIFQISYDGPPEGLMVGFGINSRLFNPHYFHGDITGGTCEDWLFLYDNSPFHTIHTHSVPFYVKSVDGVELDEKERYWADTFEAIQNFTATVCFPPRDIESYINVHCHMMQHQDVGMAAFYKLLPGDGGSESEVEEGNPVNIESSSGKKQMSVVVVAFAVLSILYSSALL